MMRRLIPRFVGRFPSRSLLAPLVSLGCLVASSGATAASWTNQAGQVLEATLVDFQSGQVTLRRPSGRELNLPIGALTAENQRAIKARFGHSVVPAHVASAFADARAILRRYQRMSVGGDTTGDQAKINRMALAVFDERMRGYPVERLSVAEQDEIASMRAALAHGRVEKREAPR